MNNVEIEEVPTKVEADREIFGEHLWRAIVPTMMDIVDQVFEVKDPVVSAIQDVRHG